MITGGVVLLAVALILVMGGAAVWGAVEREQAQRESGGHGDRYVCGDCHAQIADGLDSDDIRAVMQAVVMHYLDVHDVTSGIAKVRHDVPSRAVVFTVEGAAS